MGAKHGILLDLRDLNDIFTEADARFVMQEGNALGWGRYRDIMEWDEDIDLAIVDPLTAKQFRKILKGMMERGWSTPSLDNDFLYSFRTVKFNGGLWRHESPYFVARPNALKLGAEVVTGHKAVFPERFFLNPVQVDFLNRKFWVPNHLEEYLNYRYGEWKDNIIKVDAEWKLQEDFVMKWQQIMPLDADPAEVNKEFLCETEK